MLGLENARYDLTLDPNDYIVTRVIGCGTYGAVFAVRHRETHATFGLKLSTVDYDSHFHINEAITNVNREIVFGSQLYATPAKPFVVPSLQFKKATSTENQDLSRFILILTSSAKVSCQRIGARLNSPTLAFGFTLMPLYTPLTLSKPGTHRFNRPQNMWAIREILFALLWTIKSGRQAIGFVHNDLSRSNVMLTTLTPDTYCNLELRNGGQSRVYRLTQAAPIVLDYGISSSFFTRAKYPDFKFRGTYDVMPPEVLEAEIDNRKWRNVSHNAIDPWSIGILIYYYLSGRDPLLPYPTLPEKLAKALLFRSDSHRAPWSSYIGNQLEGVDQQTKNQLTAVFQGLFHVDQAQRSNIDQLLQSDFFDVLIVPDGPAANNNRYVLDLDIDDLEVDLDNRQARMKELTEKFVYLNLQCTSCSFNAKYVCSKSNLPFCSASCQQKYYFKTK